MEWLGWAIAGFALLVLLLVAAGWLDAQAQRDREFQEFVEGLVRIKESALLSTQHQSYARDNDNQTTGDADERL